MSPAQSDGEWRLGWRIVAACAVANGTGVSLMFFTFSLFLLPISHELGLTRGQGGLVQSLIVTAALGAPVMGYLADRIGFRALFLGCTLVVGLIELFVAWWVNSILGLAGAIAAVGFVGGGSAVVVLTRPVNAHFRAARGLALGLVGAGVSITTIVVPPLLERIIREDGWRSGYIALAAIAVVVGIPMVLALFPRSADKPLRTVPALSLVSEAGDRSFFRAPDFWLLTAANILAAVAISGAISQLSPMIQAQGHGAATAALGISAFAVGQLMGKVGGGLLLDRFDPRLVAAMLNAIPALGFILLLSGQSGTAAVLLAAGLIGLLQGADIGIFAYFVARRFDLARYGTIYGAMSGLGWIGTATGAIGFGATYDRFATYAPAQAAAIGFLMLAALALLQVRLPARAQR
ncbi:MFS transporter [Novosphingobium aquiterrae]|uniref:MFS transporter n=1 Tax=Novosphingobium aquiterrae TaxID=624388 RepID=A0ABV6PG49_9SPHN